MFQKQGDFKFTDSPQGDKSQMFFLFDGVIFSAPPHNADPLLAL